MHWNSVDKWTESNSIFTDMCHELFKAMQYAYIAVNWLIIGSDNCQAITWTKDDFWRINTLRPRKNGLRFQDDILTCIFLNENILILIKISLNFVPKGPFNNIPTLFQIVAWCWPGDKPSSLPMMVELLMHISITWPQWVKPFFSNTKRTEWYAKYKLYSYFSFT